VTARASASGYESPSQAMRRPCDLRPTQREGNSPEETIANMIESLIDSKYKSN